MEKENKNVKERKSGSRNTEKRRERSKVAARCRRGKECEIFTELASCLPLTEVVRKTLDKASVARLAVTHLKLTQMMGKVFDYVTFPESGNTGGGDTDMEFDQLLNQAMGGFVFVLTGDGDLAYVSESVTKCLGLPQCEVLGQSIFDFTHPCDHEDIRSLVHMGKNRRIKEPVEKTGFFRMKCTITAKGKSVHLRAATYKGITCNGRLYLGDKDERWFIGVGEPLCDPTDVNFPLNKQAFVTRHSMDMKCEDVAGCVQEFTGFEPEDLVGQSFYDFYHGGDGHFLSKNVKALYSKGQVQTDRYRFLAKTGGWAWCVTQATVLKSESGSKPNGIVCLHFVTSGIEHASEIVSVLQTPSVAKITTTPSPETIQLPDIFPGLSTPTPSTAKIFVPRTEDMDSGFLIPLDDSTLIVSKDEPEDLTHLAPTAGEDCVELCVPLLEELLRSFEEASFSFNFADNYVDLEVNNPLDWWTQSPDQSPMSESEMPLVESPTSMSPLFLHTDPPIVRPLDALLSSVAQSIDPIEPEEHKGLDVDDNWAGIELEGTDDKLYPLLEELSEYRAPFIHAVGEDIELLYSPDSMQIQDPGGPDLSCGIGTIPLAPPGSANPPVAAPLVEKSLSKFSDKNIDQITWTLDIGSIFASRKPEDQPRVTTSSVFTTLDSPPPKVRKISRVLASTLPASQGLQEPPSVLDVRKCPFLKSCSTLKFSGRSASSSVGDRGSGSGTGIPNGGRPPVIALRKRDLCGALVHAGGSMLQDRLPRLFDLAPEDYERIVPLDTTLLQGSELMRALELETGSDLMGTI